MYNWNTDTTLLKKSPEKYAIWKLEQMINYGLDGKKINKKELLTYWDKIRIDKKNESLLPSYYGTNYPNKTTTTTP